MRIFKGPSKVAFGFGLGVVAAGVLKEILPVWRGVGRPLLKATVKSGLILAAHGRSRFEEFRETLADVTAEAQSELRQESAEFQSHEPFTEAPKQNAGIM